MSLQKLKSWWKRPPYVLLREKVQAAIETGELTRHMPLGAAFRIIQMLGDSLDLVEILMVLEEHGLHKSDSVGDLLSLLESEDDEYKRKHP